MRFDSKLPDVGTTIFTIMSRRAIEEGALNIGQGFPDYPIDPRLAQSLVEAVSAGHNQYAPMEGVIALRELIAAKLAASYGISVDPSSEITVTCGATEALYDAIQAVIGPGDEAMIFDPAYDAYEPAVRLAGGRCVRIPLMPPTFAFDWDRIRESLTPRTRLVIVNSPQNPSCTIASRADLDALAAAGARPPHQHSRRRGVRERGLRWASACLGARSPRAAGAQLRGIFLRQGAACHGLAHRLLRRTARCSRASCARCINSTPSALQRLCSTRSQRYLTLCPDAWSGLSAFFERKRDLLTECLQGSGLKTLRAAGTYFLLVDYGSLSRATDLDFSDRLIREAKVATIPLSPFYAEPPPMTLLRLCIAKKDETLTAAAERLRSFAAGSRASLTPAR